MRLAEAGVVCSFHDTCSSTKGGFCIQGSLILLFIFGVINGGFHVGLE